MVVVAMVVAMVVVAMVVEATVVVLEAGGWAAGARAVEGCAVGR